MSLETRIKDALTAVATNIKLALNRISGNNTGDLSGLNTANKANLLGAINEVNTAQAAKIPLAQKGAANGVATLDGGGKVPAAQLPGYVDDVLEYADRASFPDPGEGGKLYLAIDTGHIWRWTGTTYVDLTGASGAVSSVFGRSGAVTAQNGDYNSGQITNSSGVPGATVGAALDSLDAEIEAAATTANGAVSFAAAQVLSGAQQLQAQDNIQVYSRAQIGNPDADLAAYFNAAMA